MITLPEMRLLSLKIVSSSQWILILSSFFVMAANAHTEGDVSSKNSNATNISPLPISRNIESFPSTSTQLTSASAVENYIDEHKEQFGFSKDSYIDAEQSAQTNGYSVYRIQQQLKGIDLFGHQSMLLVKNGQPQRADVVSTDLTAPPQLSSEQWQQIISKVLLKENLSASQFLKFNPVFWRKEQRLIAAIQIEHGLLKDGAPFPYTLFVDANGEILQRFSHRHQFSYKVFDVDHFCQSMGFSGTAEVDELFGVIHINEARYPAVTSTANATSINSKKLAQILDSAKNFMKVTLGQEGIDGRNRVQVYAFVGDNFYNYSLGCDGSNETNAFWYKKDNITGVMQIHQPILQNPEVVMHELAHGFISYSSNLIYYGESGALNEAFADAMAVSYSAGSNSRMQSPARRDWQLYLGTDLIRDFVSPSSVPNMPKMPDHYQVRYQGAEDEGGVHINSSIINHAFYLLAQGGSHTRLGGAQVKGIGLEKAMRIWFYGSTKILTNVSDFSSARHAFADAAEIIYGEYAPERTSVHQAFDAVGIPGSWVEKVPPVSTPQPLPESQPQPEPQPQPQPQQEPPLPKPQPKPQPKPTPEPKTHPLPESLPPVETPPVAESTDTVKTLALFALIVMIGLIYFVLRKGKTALNSGQNTNSYAQYPAQPVKPAQLPRLYLHTPNGTFSLPTDKLNQGVIVGRNSAADIQLQHASVSSFHLKIKQLPKGVSVEDLGSSYGTDLAGKSLTKGVAVESTLPTELRLADYQCLLSLSADSSELAAIVNALQNQTVEKSNKALVNFEICVDGQWYGFSQKDSPITLGRSADCSLCLKAASVSKQHLQIVYQQQKWWIEDLSSSYGSALRKSGLIISLSPKQPIVADNVSEIYLADTCLNIRWLK